MRSTTPKRILSKKDKWSAAFLAALFGRELSMVETLLFIYYGEASMKVPRTRAFKKALGEHGLTAKERRALQQKLKISRDLICSMFLEAVDKHDGDKILEIANAVWFFKNFTADPGVAEDPVRVVLLTIKKELQEQNKAIELSEVARFLKNSGIRTVGDAYDGYSGLRRKCKQLEIPLVDSRKIRRKSATQCLIKIIGRSVKVSSKGTGGEL